MGGGGVEVRAAQQGRVVEHTDKNHVPAGVTFPKVWLNTTKRFVEHFSDISNIPFQVVDFGHSDSFPKSAACMSDILPLAILSQ